MEVHIGFPADLGPLIQAVTDGCMRMVSKTQVAFEEVLTGAKEKVTNELQWLLEEAEAELDLQIKKLEEFLATIDFRLPTVDRRSFEELKEDVLSNEFNNVVFWYNVPELLPNQEVLPEEMRINPLVLVEGITSSIRRACEGEVTEVGSVVDYEVDMISKEVKEEQEK